MDSLRKCSRNSPWNPSEGCCYQNRLCDFSRSSSCDILRKTEKKNPRAFLGIFPSGPRGFSLRVPADISVGVSGFLGFLPAFLPEPPGTFCCISSRGSPGISLVVPRKINTGVVFFSGIPSRVPPKISQIVFLFFFRPYSQDLSRAHLGIFAIVSSEIFLGRSSWGFWQSFFLDFFSGFTHLRCFLFRDQCSASHSLPYSLCCEKVNIDVCRSFQTGGDMGYFREISSLTW